MRPGPREEALKRAYKFLGYRARSEAEVRLKLTQLGFSQETVETTLEKLRSLNFLNDEAFARGWVLERVENRGYGPLRVEQELRRKGIANSLISRIMQEAFGQQEVKKKARKLLEKRFKGKDLANMKMLRRAVWFLRRRGYRNSLIAELLHQATRGE
ncbi:MAG: regulatory protein RecX [Candidatus Binatia bacterium]